MKTYLKKDLLPANLWRAAVHESAHWAFIEYLGMSSPVRVSIVPDINTMGRVTNYPDFIVTPESQRNRLLMLVAGSVAENVINGSRRFPDGSDFEQSVDLIQRMGIGASISAAMTVAAQIIRGPLWVPILTCATVLFEVRELDRDAAREVWWAASPEGRLWAERDEIDAAWIAAGGAETIRPTDALIRSMVSHESA